MSHRDVSEYGSGAQDLIGHPFALSVATNSLKFMFAAQGQYLWIDPPWHLKKDGSVLETSENCPHPESEQYEQRFSKWAGVIHSFISSFESAAFDSGAATFLVGKGVLLCVPDDQESLQSDSWYDQWYVSKSKKSSA